MSAVHPKYRPDIDGLRALAVLPVVIFHAFPESLRGGYIGVDVFFVISGFLISSIIFSNIEKGTFSFLDFYSRRIRRIYPTLLTVLLGCLIFGYFSLFPEEYKQLGKHIAGSSVFISNFILLSESGYFDTSSISKPLLHLWSLGVEEQFYIIWPLLLALFVKRKFNLFVVAFLCFLASFYLNLRTISVDPSQTFYSPFTRFWEILAGSMLAWMTLNKKEYFTSLKAGINGSISAILGKNYDFIANALSIAGLLILIYGYSVLTEDLQFPGLYALIPVSGACLLIMAGPSALVNKHILSFKLLVWVGLISFPLYLWHWPLLSFAYIIESGEPSPLIRLMLVIVAIVMSVLSYHFIENKLRFGGNLAGKTIVLFLAMVLMGMIGLFVYHANGFDGRFAKTADEINDEHRVNKLITDSRARCAAVFPNWSKLTDNLCAMQKPSGQNGVAIIGDSHANHLFVGMSEAKAKEGVAVFPASCAAPFIDVASALKDPKALHVRQYSYKLIDEAYDYVVKDKNIHEVILAHNPSCSFNDAVDMQNTAIKDSSVIIENGMRRSLDKLISAGKKVIIVKDNPELPFIPQACVVHLLRSSQGGGKCKFDKAFYSDNKAHNSYNSVIDTVTKDYPSVSVVNLSKAFCDKDTCYISKDGHVLYGDKTHLNKYGSRYVAPLIAAK
ncbi:acyltransferase [Escherichia coli]|nr:acyltransferase [Escherichia coli]